MTNGMKSTEFWASMVAVGIGAYLSTTGAGVEVIMAVVAPVMVYTGARAHTKKK